MARQYLIPGLGYINETSNRQYLLPGFSYINETGTIFTGTVAVTEASDSTVATGWGGITGTVAVTEASDTTVASGTSYQIIGTANITEGNDLPQATLAGVDVGSATYANKFKDLTSNPSDTLTDIIITNDGTILYAVNNTDCIIKQWTLGTAYDSSSATYSGKSFDCTAQIATTKLKAAHLTSDGTTLYLLRRGDGGSTHPVIYQYTLGTPYDISTASYASKSFDTNSQVTESDYMHISPNGVNLYVSKYAGGNNHLLIYQYTLGTPYDISTASYASKTVDITPATNKQYHGYQFSNDGTKFFYSSWFTNGGGTIDSLLTQYTASTPFDITTLTLFGSALNYSGVDFSVIDPTTTIYLFSAFRITSDGLHLYSRGVHTNGVTSTDFVAQHNIPAAGILYCVATETMTGTVAKTEQSDSCSAFERQDVTSTLAITEAHDTSAGTSTETITGTLAKTEASDSTVASGVQNNNYGTVAVTEASDSTVSTGTETITGTVVVTEASDTCAATNLQTFTGTVVVTEASDSTVSSGLETITGTVAKTEASDSTVSSGLETITGTVVKTEASDTCAATNLQIFTGTVNVSEGGDTTVASGVSQFSSTAASTEANDSSTASATETITGTLAKTEASDTAVATATLKITGTVNVSEAGDTTTVTAHTGDVTINVDTIMVTVTCNPQLYELQVIKCTGEPVPASHFADAKKLQADAYIELFEITLSDKVTKLYLTLNKTKTWQGHTYEGTGIKLTGVANYADDQTSRPSFQLLNPAGVFSSLVDQGLLENAIVARIRLLKAHLDADLPIYRKQRWRVTRVASLKNTTIGMELRDMLDGQNFLLPPRMFIPPDFPMVNLS